MCFTCKDHIAPTLGSSWWCYQTWNRTWGERSFGDFFPLEKLQEAPYFCQFCSVATPWVAPAYTPSSFRAQRAIISHYKFTFIRFLLCLSKSSSREFLVLSLLGPGRSQGAICLSQHGELIMHLDLLGAFFCLKPWGWREERRGLAQIFWKTHPFWFLGEWVRE